MNSVGCAKAVFKVTDASTEFCDFFVEFLCRSEYESRRVMKLSWELSANQLDRDAPIPLTSSERACRP